MIVGFSEGYHDAALAILENNSIVFASQSERYSRVKNYKWLHNDLVQIANDCDPSRIAFYERPWLKKTRQIYSGQWNKVFNKRRLSLQPTDYFGHHLSHAASAFQTSLFDQATVIVVDSIGEWDTVSVWIAQYINDRAQYKKAWSRKYPYSLGLFYSAITDRVGLKPNEDEYILMGMSSYGCISDAYYDMQYQLQHVNNHRGCRGLYPWIDDYDLAAMAQAVLEEELEYIFRKALSITQIGNVCYGGGVALNCVANSRLAELVDDMWIFPNPGDAGSAVGAAALVERKRIEFSSCYLGHDIAKSYPVKRALDELLNTGVVGIANGKAEFGPRALGNRSLLADPRTIQMKDKVNSIKKRQEFRPFAPVVLEEHAADWFDIDRSSPYMQYVYKCKRPDLIPAVCHFDNTSRVQTVSKNNSGIRKLLEAWYNKTGCPVLLNTSLNIKGQPIVNTIEDARDFQNLYNIKVF
jgi:carbamoyltransferase